MSTIIKVRCTDQVLTFENTPVIASGGLEEDFVSFAFCSKWDGLVKTAVFWRSEEEVYHVLLDEADSCPIPREVLAVEGVIYFGVFGVNEAGKQRTSEVLRYNVAKGAITEGTKPTDPTPDIYTQILGEFLRYENEIDAKLDDFAQSWAEYQTAMTQARTDHEEAVAQWQEDLETAVSETQESYESRMNQEWENFKTGGDFVLKTDYEQDQEADAAKVAAVRQLAQNAKDSILTPTAISNIHVWERVQQLSEPIPAVPAGYNIGADTFPSVGNCWFRLINSSIGTDGNTLHAGDVVANDDGTLAFTTSQRIGVYSGTVYGFGASGSNSGNRMTADTITTEYRGKFIKASSGTTVQFASGLEENVVYYVPTDATVSIVIESKNAKIVFSDLRAVSSYPYTPAIPAGTNTEYLASESADAYQEGEADGIKCTYLGQLGNKSRVEVGNYVGTGAGASASTAATLTFPFAPKFLWILGAFSLSGVPTITAANTVAMLRVDQLTTEFVANGGFKTGTTGTSYGKKSEDGKTISWYNSSGANYIFNKSGTTYQYIAIG